MIERPSFTRPIRTLEDGKRFIDDLFRADLLFHFEDDPVSIGNLVDGEWVDTFTEQEAEELRERVAELYALDWGSFECPIGYALFLLPPVED